MIVNRDEAIFRMYLKKRGLGWARNSLRRELREGVSFSMFNMCMRVGILLRAVRVAIL